MSRNRAIILLSAGHACVDVYQGSVAALVPFFAAERAYGYAAVSGIVLAASLLSSVAQPLFGALTDRWAMPWLLPSATLLGGLGIALGGLVDSYALTLTFVAVSGIGVAAYHPEAARVARIAGGGRHTAMGWFSLGGNIGFAAAPVLVTAVMALGGLRMSPLLVVPALAGSVLCLPVLRALARSAHTGASSSGVADVDDWRSFAKLSAAVVFRSIVFVGLSTFVSLYAQQRIGGGTTTGSAALFLLYLGGAAGTLLGSRLAGRRERVTVVRWSYLATIGAVAGVVFAPGPALFPFVLLAAVGLYIPFSLQITLAQDYLPTRVGTAGGVTLGLTVSIGGLASPVIGTIADHTSLQTGLLPLIALPALCWLATRSLREPDAPKATEAQNAPDGMKLTDNRIR
ncbi:MFS transporter [Amycolatopsis decaplanina]|uniref:Fosmidmycin resistance protein n=1 Tax=Amycolatopsis decaplanina DSM 44594 TaxID=1284240 RepID=M2Z8H9_9PSEU|nr:MFS transporter [Amycolatopsis decaplanina]EME57158.1 fosmidmycin resistance protein [Amycolatopsis decaplanina DSM 44594]